MKVQMTYLFFAASGALLLMNLDHAESSRFGKPFGKPVTEIHFGHLNPTDEHLYAGIIYSDWGFLKVVTKDVKAEIEKDSIITFIKVFDFDWKRFKGKAEIVAGGINHNYVKFHFTSPRGRRIRMRYEIFGRKIDRKQ